MLIAYEERLDHGFYPKGQIVRVYSFLHEGCVWTQATLQYIDTFSCWIKPVRFFTRFNPGMKRPPRNMGTQYPGGSTKP